MGLQESGGRNLRLDDNDLRVWKKDCHPGLVRSTCAEGQGARESGPGEQICDLLSRGMGEGLKPGWGARG